MRKIGYIAILAALFGVACTGHTEEETTLRPSKTEIIADGYDEVTFTVNYMGEDVTADAVITVSPEGTMDGNAFTTEEHGTYTFTAMYNGITSMPVTVTAREAALSLSAELTSTVGDTRNFRFTSRYGTRDVSTDPELTVIEQDGAPLTPDTDGYYKVSTTGEEVKVFYATWGDHTSPMTVVGPLNFYKRVSVLEFTGTWCNNCPRMAEFIQAASTAYPDRTVLVAIHAFQQDPMATPYFETLATQLRATALPATLLDMGKPIVGTQNTSPGDIETRLRNIVGALPDGAACGLAVDVEVEGGEVVATVRLMAAQTMEFKLAAMLLENGIKAPEKPQTLPDYSHDPNYVHNHVLRQVWQNNIEGVTLGQVATGEQKQREFRFPLGSFDPENCSVVVVANSAAGTLTTLNAVECAVGESVGFEYE